MSKTIPNMQDIQQQQMFCTKLYRQVVGIPMGTNCAPLVADLFLFCYERDFMMSLSDDKQADVIDAFNTTSRYLDDILNVDGVYFDNVVGQIYPSELQFNKANASDTEAAFLDLHLSISGDIVSTKIYDKRDDFDFEVVGFPFLDGDVPRSTSYGVYVSRLVRFARASSYVADFGARNELLTQKLLKQGYRCRRLRKTFSKFCGRYYDLISEFRVGLGSLLRQGLSEPDFYGDWCVGWGGLLALIIFQRSSLRWFPVVGGLAVALMCCSRLRAWWSTRLRLATLLSSLVARRWVGLQTL